MTDRALQSAALNSLEANRATTEYGSIDSAPRTDDGLADPGATNRSEVSRKSIAALVVKVAMSLDVEVGHSLGLSKPEMVGDPCTAGRSAARSFPI
jgi:hypothetical protein